MGRSLWISRVLCRAAALACVFLVASAKESCAGTILLSNLADVNGGSFSVNADPPGPSGARALGVQFTLDQKTTINSVEMDLASGGLSIPSGDVFLQVYSSNSSNHLGGYLGQLGGAAGAIDQSAFSAFTFSSTTGLTLGQGTYYLMLFNASSNRLYWETSTQGDTTSYGSITGRIYAGNTGQYESPHYLGFTMSGTAVPEPGSLVLGCLGLVGMVASRSLRRMRRRAA